MPRRLGGLKVTPLATLIHLVPELLGGLIDEIALRPRWRGKYIIATSGGLLGA